jgi:hypothetical protein
MVVLRSEIDLLKIYECNTTLFHSVIIMNLLNSSSTFDIDGKHSIILNSAKTNQAYHIVSCHTSFTQKGSLSLNNSFTVKEENECKHRWSSFGYNSREHRRCFYHWRTDWRVRKAPLVSSSSLFTTIHPIFTCGSFASYFDFHNILHILAQGQMLMILLGVPLVWSMKE